LLSASGALAYAATRRIWHSYQRACELAERLELRRREGGIAFILPPAAERAAAGAVFFTLPEVVTPARDAGWEPASITQTVTPLEPGWERAAVMHTTQAVEPGWEPGEVTIYPATPAEREALKQSNGWVRVPLFGKWRWVRVALEPEADAPAARTVGKLERRP
jgi:hypothetical protein